MLDNDIIQVFRPLIINGLTSLGITASVLQGYQPTKQGTQSTTSIYFYKISDARYGFVQRTNKWNTNTLEMDYTETQTYETVFQISSLVKQDPNNISFTASDVVNYVSQILQSRSTLDTLRASGLSIYRIQGIRNTYFNSDDENYQANPSFDITIQHNQTITTEVPIISTFESNFQGV